MQYVRQRKTLQHTFLHIVNNAIIALVYRKSDLVISNLTASMNASMNASGNQQGRPFFFAANLDNFYLAQI